MIIRIHSLATIAICTLSLASFAQAGSPGSMPTAAKTSPAGQPAAKTTGTNAGIAAAESAPMTEGEIRKIDAAAGTVTLKHGEIAHLNMPGMTMVFNARDRSALQGLKVGDKIRFSVVREGSKFVVTEIVATK